MGQNLNLQKYRGDCMSTSNSLFQKVVTQLTYSNCLTYSRFSTHKQKPGE